MPEVPSLHLNIPTPQPDIDPALQDELAKRQHDMEYAQASPLRQAYMRASDRLSGLAGGFMGLPDKSGLSPNNVGFAIGAIGAPGLGVLERMFGGSIKALRAAQEAKEMLPTAEEIAQSGRAIKNLQDHGARNARLAYARNFNRDYNTEDMANGPLTQPGQALYDFLERFVKTTPSSPSPEDLSKAVASSRATNLRGNPPSRLIAPEGTRFRIPGPYQGLVSIQKSVEMGPTPATEALKRWYQNRELPSKWDFNPEVYSGGGGSLEDIAAMARANPDAISAPTRTGVSTKGRQFAGGEIRTNASLRKAGITADIVRKIRNYPTFEEAVKAYPTMAKDKNGLRRLKDIYEGLSFPGVK